MQHIKNKPSHSFYSTSVWELLTDSTSNVAGNGFSFYISPHSVQTLPGGQVGAIHRGECCTITNYNKFSPEIRPKTGSPKAAMAATKHPHSETSHGCSSSKPHPKNSESPSGHISREFLEAPRQPLQLSNTPTLKHHLAVLPPSLTQRIASLQQGTFLANFWKPQGSHGS